MAVLIKFKENDITPNIYHLSQLLLHEFCK